MGLWGILKANLGSIKTQRKLEAAMAMEDHEKATRLIAESISNILKAGLTSKQLAALESIRADQGDLLNQCLTAAFQRGWTRSGVPNLSNAMDEVLREAQRLITEFRKPDTRDL